MFPHIFETTYWTDFDVVLRTRQGRIGSRIKSGSIKSGSSEIRISLKKNDYEYPAKDVVGTASLHENVYITQTLFC